MEIIQKSIVVVLLSLTSLFSAELVGTWQIDMPKSQKYNPLDKMDESKQLVVMMYAGVWREIKFAADHTFTLTKSKQQGLWQKSGNIYLLKASENAPQSKLIKIDNDHIKVIFNDPKIGFLTLCFRCLKKQTKNTNMDKVHFYSVYRADESRNHYDFLLLTKEGKYHYVQTDRIYILSPDELMSEELESLLVKKKEFGESFIDRGSYVIDGNNFITELLGNTVEVISPNKLKYLGKVFILVKEAKRKKIR